MWCDKYADIAISGLGNDNAGANAVAQAFGYSPEELASIPAEANMGLSCGNPTATAHLRAGEIVVDLGSGGGLDVFLAAKKVGPAGRAIGIDMTPEMIERAPRGPASRDSTTSNSTCRRSTRYPSRMTLLTALFPTASSTWLPTKRRCSGKSTVFSSQAAASPSLTLRLKKSFRRRSGMICSRTSVALPGPC